MKKSPATTGYSSYARTLLSEIKSLSTLIRKYSRPKPVPTEGTIPQLDTSMFNLLSNSQINEALINPQTAIRPSMHAYISAFKVHREVLSSIELADNQRRLMKDTLASLRQKLADSNAAQEKELLESIAALEAASKKTVELQKNLQQYQEELLQKIQQIEQLIPSFDQQWDTYRHHYLEKIPHELTKIDISLNEEETAALLHQETWSEILMRYQELELEIPTAFSVEAPDYTTYFRLKTYLAIYSNYTRRQEPYKQEEIVRFVKKLL